jgi:hypothetical protein
MKRDFLKVAYFADERTAAIYQARLEEAGIPSFLSNANANVMLPHLGGGVGVHINKQHLELSKEIYDKIQELQYSDQSVFTHHDATHEDIQYEKELNSKDQRWNTLSKIAVVLLFLVLLRYIAKSKGLLPQFFEPF